MGPPPSAAEPCPYKQTVRGVPRGCALQAQGAEPLGPQPDGGRSPADGFPVKGGKPRTESRSVSHTKRGRGAGPGSPELPLTGQRGPRAGRRSGAVLGTVPRLARRPAPGTRASSLLRPAPPAPTTGPAPALQKPPAGAAATRPAGGGQQPLEPPPSGTLTLRSHLGEAECLGAGAGTDREGRGLLVENG